MFRNKLYSLHCEGLPLSPVREIHAPSHTTSSLTFPSLSYLHLSPPRFLSVVEFRSGLLRPDYSSSAVASFDRQWIQFVVRSLLVKSLLVQQTELYSTSV